MSLPVLIFANDPSCGRLLAGVSVLDRLVVAAHSAEAEAIFICGKVEQMELRHADALGIKVNWVDKPPALEEDSLLVSGQLMAGSSDLKRVMAAGGRLVSDARDLLPCGVAGEWKGSLEASLPDRPKVGAEGVVQVVKDGLTAVQGEDALWDALDGPADGLVDAHFNRPLGRPLSRMLIHTRMSPNAVSLLATALGLGAAFCFTLGLGQWMILGAVLLQFAAVVACVEGDLARMSLRESPTGKWMARGGEQLVRLCLFAGMAAGVHRLHEGNGPALWLGLSAAMGTVIFFVMMLRSRGPRQRFIDKASNRDFTVVLLALTLAERIDWFLWLAAGGVHVYWLLALCVPQGNDREGRA